MEVFPPLLDISDADMSFLPSSGLKKDDNDDDEDHLLTSFDVQPPLPLVSIAEKVSPLFDALVRSIQSPEARKVIFALVPGWAYTGIVAERLINTITQGALCDWDVVWCPGSTVELVSTSLRSALASRRNTVFIVLETWWFLEIPHAVRTVPWVFP